jgi:hypothetical protein
MLSRVEIIRLKMRIPGVDRLPSVHDGDELTGPSIDMKRDGNDEQASKTIEKM